MKDKRIAIFMLLVALLMLGGVRRPDSGQTPQDDPARRGAETLAAASGGDSEAWLAAAKKNPQWLLQINAEQR